MRRIAIASCIVVALSACSKDSTSPEANHTFKFRMSALHFPSNVTEATSFAFDMDGDGGKDNALGNIFVALESNGLDLQGPENNAASVDSIKQRLVVVSSDTTLTNDATATAGFLDPTAPAIVAVFSGSIASGTFASQTPVTPAPVVLNLRLALVDSTTIVTLPVYGAHLTFTRVPGSPPSLANGVLNGVIKATDMNNIFVPTLAVALNKVIAADSTTATARSIQQLFDQGGCAGAVADDYQINVCEVQTNPLVTTLLAPDLDMFTAGGVYQPNPANTSPDALSFGFGFTATSTTF